MRFINKVYTLDSPSYLWILPRSTTRVKRARSKLKNVLVPAATEDFPARIATLVIPEPSKVFTWVFANRATAMVIQINAILRLAFAR